ncbi:MAG: AMP-binding protein [Bifidobacteriaceae bacterium]|nr:AMP-binding protein [Bifidobacteriaceae bacterium]
MTGSPLVLSSALAAGDGAARADRPGQTSRAAGEARRRAKGQAAQAAIQRYGVRVVAAVPAQLGFLAAQLEALGAPAQPSRERLRRIVTGGDPMDAATAAALRRRFGPVLVNYYGSTETGAVTVAVGADLDRDPTTVGRPVVGARVQVIGSDGAVLPRGQVGRVRVSSLLASPGAAPDGRPVVLADLGQVDQAGRLHIVGRAKRA